MSTIPKKFQGKIYFYWQTEFGYLIASHYQQLSDEYALLGETDEIHIKFDANESTRKAVEAIEKQIEAVYAARQDEISRLETRKAELLALGNEVAA